jgi:hypothetical protein
VFLKNLFFLFLFQSFEYAWKTVHTILTKNKYSNTVNKNLSWVWWSTYLPVLTIQLREKVLCTAGFPIFQKNTVYCSFPEASSKTFSIHGPPVHHVAPCKHQENYICYARIPTRNKLTSWKYDELFYELIGRNAFIQVVRQMENWKNSPQTNVLCEFVTDRHYSIPVADNCSLAKEAMSLCENTILKKLQLNILHLTSFVFPCILSHILDLIA